MKDFKYIDTKNNQVVIDFKIDTQFWIHMSFSIKIPNEANFNFKPAIASQGDEYGTVTLQLSPKISYEFIEKLQGAIDAFWVSSKKQAN